jgi:hypothetical protein
MLSLTAAADWRSPLTDLTAANDWLTSMHDQDTWERLRLECLEEAIAALLSSSHPNPPLH